MNKVVLRHISTISFLLIIPFWIVYIFTIEIIKSIFNNLGISVTVLISAFIGFILTYYFSMNEYTFFSGDGIIFYIITSLLMSAITLLFFTIYAFVYYVMFHESKIEGGE